jgi:hypothetical chaperone protein
MARRESSNGLRSGNGLRLGIDFGTTNSAAAVYDGQQLHAVEMETATMGRKQILPSLIYVDRQYHVTLGQDAAREYARRETGRAVRWKTKNFGTLTIVVAGAGGSPIIYDHPIVLTFDDAAMGRLLQSIKTALRNHVYHGTQIFDRFYTIDELIATVLGHLKERAEAQFGQPCTSVVIGRPVTFSDNPRISARAEEIIYKAARKVGFEDIAFHMEPIGALYVYHVSNDQRKRALVFDFGGGTLDLTVAEVGGGIAPKVLSTVGVLVGGDDLDKRIMQSLYSYFGEDTSRGESLPFEIANSLTDWQTMPDLTRPQFKETFKFLRKTHPRPDSIEALVTLVSKNIGFSLFREIERVKRQLTDEDQVELKFIYENINIDETITRTKFERIIAPELQKVEDGIWQTLAEANVQPEDIDVVLRTGGSSLVPAIVRLLAGIFGEDKLQALDSLTSVVGGLGIIAHEDRGLRGAYRSRYHELDAPLQFESMSSQPLEIYEPQVGAKCYADRDTVIRKMPVELCGFRGLRTVYFDHNRTDDDYLSITLETPGRIYVGYTSSATTMPHWIRDYIDQDFKIEIQDDWWGIRELNVYARSVEAGETVMIGANQSTGASGRTDPQYLVIIEG